MKRAEKCLAALLYGPMDIRIEQVGIPAIGPDDFLVQVKGCTICGSDLAAYLGRHPRVNTYPQILGHEFGGVVAEVGENVSDSWIGRRVVCDNIIACGSCDECRKGQKNICMDRKSIGFNVSGAYSEYVKVPKGNVYHLPDNMSFEEACLVQTLGVAYNAVKYIARVTLNDRVLILGCGGIGLSALIMCRASGANVICSDVVDARLNLARKFGADVVINSKKEDLVGRVREITGGKGVDIAIEAVGGEQDMTLRLCTQVAKRSGLVVLIGTFSSEATLRAAEFKAKQMQIRGSQGYVDAFADLIPMISSGKIEVSQMVTHHLRLVQLEEGFKLMENMNEEILKIMISP